MAKEVHYSRGSCTVELTDWLKGSSGGPMSLVESTRVHTGGMELAVLPSAPLALVLDDVPIFRIVITCIYTMLLYIFSYTYHRRPRRVLVMKERGCLLQSFVLALWTALAQALVQYEGGAAQ